MLRLYILLLSGMKKSVSPKIESGSVFKSHINKTCVVAFNNQSFDQGGNVSALLGKKYYKPFDLLFQQLTVK